MASKVLSTTVPSSVLKKKQNVIAYHRVREAMAAKVMRFAFLKSEENVSDILTKPLVKFLEWIPSSNPWKLIYNKGKRKEKVT